MTAFDLWRLSYQRAALTKRLNPGARRAALVALFHLHLPANDTTAPAA